MSEPTFVDTSLGTLVRIEHGWPFESAYFREQLTGRPIVVAVGNFQYTGGFRFASTTVKEYAGEYPRQFELKPGDILLVMTCQTPGGEILGIPARIPDDGRLYLHNQRLGKVVLKRPDLADLDYLYYVFLSRDFNDELVASSTGTKIVHTAPSRIEAFRFRLPPLDVQRSIASLLKALDEKIESNRTINVAVETLAAGLFRSWLVDFEPVIAKRDGQRPVGVPAEAIDLFASHFEESELGPIPQGWRPSTIGAEVTVVGGSTPSTNEPRFWNGDVCWVTPRDLSRLDDPVVLDTERHITQEGLEQISSGLLPVGTVLLSSRAPIGYIAIAEVPVAVNQGFIAMKCDKQLSSHFVVNWVQENLNEVLSRAGGTTFAEISKAAFRPIPLVVPPPEVLEVFDQVIAPLHAMRVANVRESRSLAELRATLIGPLVSGDLCFKTAEKAVGAAF